MKVVLFGSLANPLSAEVAKFLYNNGMLAFVVKGNTRSISLNGGLPYLLSMAFLAGYRFLHIILRRLKIKTSDDYQSLLEFLYHYPDVKKVSFSDLQDEVKVENKKKIGKFHLEEYIVMSCIFPDLIPLPFLGIKTGINIHPGQLPRYRGSNPYFWALANNENKISTTFHVMTNSFDRGNILYADSINTHSIKSEFGLEMLIKKNLRQALQSFFGEYEHLFKNQEEQEGNACCRSPSFSDRAKYRRYTFIHLNDFAAILKSFAKSNLSKPKQKGVHRGSMNQFHRDLLRWKRYCVEIHSRHFRKNDIYIQTQSIVENTAHKFVAIGTKSKRAVLEIGVGGGEHLHYENIHGSNRTYVAIDLVYEHVNLCKRHYQVNTINANAELLPFKKDTFDCCVALGVVEHIPGIDNLFTEIKRVIKPGGSLLVVIPTNGSLIITLFRLLVTYPTLYLKGIKKPSRIWHYENANGFIRIMAFLEKHFHIQRKRSLPAPYLPWWLSPLYFIECQVPR